MAFRGLLALTSLTGSGLATTGYAERMKFENSAYYSLPSPSVSIRRIIWSSSCSEA